MRKSLFNDPNDISFLQKTAGPNDAPAPTPAGSPAPTPAMQLPKGLSYDKGTFFLSADWLYDKCGSDPKLSPVWNKMTEAQKRDFVNKAVERYNKSLLRGESWQRTALSAGGAGAIGAGLGYLFGDGKGAIIGGLLGAVIGFLAELSGVATEYVYKPIAEAQMKGLEADLPDILAKAQAQSATDTATAEVKKKEDQAKAEAVTQQDKVTADKDQMEGSSPFASLRAQVPAAPAAAPAAPATPEKDPVTGLEIGKPITKEDLAKAQRPEAIIGRKTTQAENTAAAIKKQEEEFAKPITKWDLAQEYLKRGPRKMETPAAPATPVPEAKMPETPAVPAATPDVLNEVPADEPADGFGTDKFREESMDPNFAPFDPVSNFSKKPKTVGSEADRA